MTQQPPPVPNPYGPPVPAQPAPHGPPPSGVPAAPPGPVGPPPGWRPPPRKKQPDAEPGRFTWWDLGATLFYVLGFLTGLVGLLALLPPINELIIGDEAQAQQATFVINAVGYGLLSVIAIVLSGAALWRSIKAFSYLWWLKLLLVPVAWVVSIVLNLVIVVLIFGSTGETSENQEAIEAMLQAVPLLAAVAVIGILGPYVEEYFFRHLLIGKLSKYLSIWICAAISVLAFPLIHFIPALLGMADDLTFISVVPYLTMGMVITVGYILSGRNLFYAWVLHAFNNVMSLLLAYFLVPWLGEYAGELHGALWLASLLG
ncbi:CPBP family intramembrane glutamic endopeptidase [Nesterenkonia sphaerica]|uniref:CPBP family intramembrane metalloprotease n=1 Tax=Nesterenkonia sphaerica TaxID=1804988 RepID=A0A5R9AMG1_9MICC|nr:CPBP family intramembrane glutamic endopeptidase [Nesterenkonia sphaerica]TLP79991.1 CPBP family intramembrane metalloprotease [Nesterenkonia sphaerica]